jgi:hypothetical protein
MSRDLIEGFLEREFEVDGEEAAAVLRIGRPVEHPEGDWNCPFQISGMGDDRIHEASGVDSLQALSMGLQMARAQLESYRRSHRITWLGGDDLGI